MVGLTLSAEQIRSAPPEVRHWLERQVAAIFAPSPAEEQHRPSHSLVACTIEEARAILHQIQDLLPVVTVFFELGREAPLVGGQGIRAFSLHDIQVHTRLRGPEQVLECLDIINKADQRLRSDSSAVVSAIDPHGRCFVADATSRSILALWQEIVGARTAEAGEPPTPAQPNTAPDPR
ncbi:MAG: hypothetical protein AB7F35_03680 [Acetobacteraceae bacterium]